MRYFILLLCCYLHCKTPADFHGKRKETEIFMYATFIDVISSLLCLKIIPSSYLTDTIIDVSLNY